MKKKKKPKQNKNGLMKEKVKTENAKMRVIKWEKECLKWWMRERVMNDTCCDQGRREGGRSEEHTSELQSPC